MKKWLSNWRLTRRLTGMALIAFVLLVSVTLHLIVTPLNHDIKFNQWEKYGNQYQRPLEALLEGVTGHRVLAAALLNGEAAQQAAVIAKQTEIDDGFTALAAAHRE